MPTSTVASGLTESSRLFSHGQSPLQVKQQDSFKALSLTSLQYRNRASSTSFQPSTDSSTSGISSGQPSIRNITPFLDGVGLNQSRNGTLSTTDARDPFDTTAFADDYLLSGIQAGQRVQINLDSSAFDAYLRVIDASTGQQLFFDDDSGGGFNSQINFVAQAGISYQIRATSFASETTGNYVLRVSGNTRTLNLAINRNRNGRLDALDGFNPLRSGSYSEDFRLTNLRVGRRVQLDLTSNTFDTYLQLVNANTGSLITFDDDGGGNLDSRLRFVVEAGVSYLARVTTFGSSVTGAFTLRSRVLNAPITRGSLAVNQRVQSSLENSDGFNPLRGGRFADNYLLTGAQANQRIRLNLESSSFDPFLQVVDARTGALITSNDDVRAGTLNSGVTLRVRAGRSYIVRVTSYAPNSIGTYSLSANLLNNPLDGSRIGINQSRNGSLTATDGINPLRADRYADNFQLVGAVAGQNLQVDLTSSGFDTYLQLVDAATGQLIAADDDSGTGTNSSLSFSVDAGRSYQLRVTSYGARATGAYSLRVQSLVSNPGTFNSTYGYGLVNAAAAVAQALGQPTFGSVADLGGNEWGNDLLNVPEVWAQGYTGQGITVAVIDSGVDIFHPELRNNIWQNTREVPNNGRDDDSNGFVDDVYGWNFGVGQNNNDVTPGTRSLGQGHGTHVAGTIAGASNGLGATGVAYNSRIMSIRLGDVDDRGSFTNAGNLARAIRYAVDNGARVINMSIGWSDSEAIAQALAYASNRGVITVSAAGNESLPAPGVPANYATEYGISVGAVDRNRLLADFSNRAGSDSRMNHVVGGGVDVLSSVPGGGYETLSGTSMASPHVAGVVALMLSANPNLTSAQVRQMLTQTTTYLV